MTAPRLRNRRTETGSARLATKREQREASLDRILASALTLFVRKGFRSSTVDEIAQASGLTKGAVYFYFPTKAAVLFALLDEIEQLMINRMVEQVAQAGPQMQDKLVAVLHGQSMLGIDKAEFVLLFILMLLEFNGTGDDIELRVKAIYKRFYESIEEIVHRGKLGGEFRTDLPTQELTAVVVALNTGTMMEWYCRPSQLHGRELVRTARDALLGGILARAPAAKKRLAARSRKPQRETI